MAPPRARPHRRRRIHPARRAHRSDPARSRSWCWRRPSASSPLEQERPPTSTMSVNLSARNLPTRHCPTASASCWPARGCRTTWSWRSRRAASWRTPTGACGSSTVCARTGVQLSDRRLRDRLLVPRLPQATTSRRGEDRQVLRHGAPARSQGRHDRGLHHRPRHTGSGSGWLPKESRPHDALHFLRDVGCDVVQGYLLSRTGHRSRPGATAHPIRPPRPPREPRLKLDAPGA